MFSKMTDEQRNLIDRVNRAIASVSQAHNANIIDLFLAIGQVIGAQLAPLDEHSKNTCLRIVDLNISAGMINATTKPEGVVPS